MCSKMLRFLIVLVFCGDSFGLRKSRNSDMPVIDVIDLTQATTLWGLMEFYGALDRDWNFCTLCGVPGLGTTLHLQHYTPSGSSQGSMTPDTIPTEYLLTRLTVIDVQASVSLQPGLVLTKEMALQWLTLRRDSYEPTMLLFRFGWTAPPHNKGQINKCVCNIPGISYELAQWIAANLTQVVAVATDAPTLESVETRELSGRTVANLLGRHGIYMIENVLIEKTLPEHGCMALAMPMKLQSINFVPTRLTAFCPTVHKQDKQVVIGLKNNTDMPKLFEQKDYDDILNEMLKY